MCRGLIYRAHGDGGATSLHERASHGKVYLVGAGPADPDLITVKGLRCLRAADRDGVHVGAGGWQAAVAGTGRGPVGGGEGRLSACCTTSTSRTS